MLRTSVGASSSRHGLGVARAASRIVHHHRHEASSSAFHSSSCTAAGKFGDELTSNQPPTSSGSSPSHRNGGMKSVYQDRKQNRITNTILKASRLGENAKHIRKDDSDQFSGWKQTPGPSSRRNVGRPKLSREAGVSKAKGRAFDINTLLGPHSASVLNQPLLSESQDPLEEASSPKISFNDFVHPRSDPQHGDFVELRNAGRAFIGVILPVPDDEQHEAANPAASNNMTKDSELFVLLSTGQAVLLQSQDVMIQIPGLVEKRLTYAARPKTRAHVLSHKADSPTSFDGLNDSSQENASKQTDPLTGTAMEEEPVDEARFEARATICNVLRILERQKEKELQRILPAFQSLFLVDQQQEQGTPTDKSANASPMKERMDIRTGTITTFEATRLIHNLLVKKSREAGNDTEAVPPVTASTVYACHSLLISTPTHFLADGLSHRTSQLFTCRNEDERRNLELVAGWITSPEGSREQSFIESFCTKAKRVRQWSESRSYDSTGQPRTIYASSSDFGDVQWTTQDQAIIDFLQASLGSRRTIQDDPHMSIAMEIIKKSGAHLRILPHPNTKEPLDFEESMMALFGDKERERGLSRAILQDLGSDVAAGSDLRHALVFRFLKDIGTLTPWHNPVRLDTSFRNLTSREQGGEPEDEGSAGAGKSSGKADISEKYGLTLDEPVEKLRHDFGRDHAIYVIDDEGAFELDDGISVEPVPGRENEQAWVHIHIADPTGLIRPDDPLGRRADRRFTSLYLPEARWAMLPDDFVRSGVGLYASASSSSVASGRELEGQRVMSFSALVDLSSGLVQDAKVRPAMVHNVQVLSYNGVSELLVSQSEGSKRQSDLSLLLTVATLLSENRARGPAFLTRRPHAPVSVSPRPLPSLPATVSALTRPQFFDGYPDIDIAFGSDVMLEDVASEKPLKPLGSFLVSELMILAGRIAGTYGQNHNLALPYRQQFSPQTDQETQSLLSLRENLPSRSYSTSASGSLAPGDTTATGYKSQIGHGLIDYLQIFTRGIMLSAASYSTKPSMHFGLGISPSPEASYAQPMEFRDALFSGGYLRATSPLRRYPDMITHWQLKHHMVHGQPLFSENDMQRQVAEIERRDMLTKQLMTASSRYWKHALVQWALLHQHDPNLSSEQRNKVDKLMSPLTATVHLPDIRINTTTLTARVRVWMDELELPADMEWAIDEPAPATAARFTVRVNNVIMAGLRSGLVVRRV